MHSGRLFVGDLSWEISSEILRKYFSRFGKVINCVAVKSPTVNKLGGYGFVTFIDPRIAEVVLKMDHRIGEMMFVVRRAIPPDQYLKAHTVYVERVQLQVQEKELEDLFSQFGPVLHATLVKNHDRTHHRGFAFVTFASEKSVIKAVMSSNQLFLRDTMLVTQRYQTPIYPGGYRSRSHETLRDLGRRGTATDMADIGCARSLGLPVAHVRSGSERRTVRSTATNLGGELANTEYWDATHRLKQQAWRLEQDVSAMIAQYRGPLPPYQKHEYQTKQKSKTMPLNNEEDNDDLIDLTSSSDEQSWML